MKVAVFFDGTGGHGNRKVYIEEKMRMSEIFGDDVIRVYISGCQHNNVGGGSISPDLSIGAKKFVDAFNENGELDIKRLRENFGSAIVDIIGPDVTEPIEVDRMLLSGFSRGAVSSISTAKELQKKNNTKNIPIDIVADQPVPGNHANLPGTTVNKVMDCRHCDNIKSATILLGSYNKNNGLTQNNFFYQVCPSFPKSTKTNYLEMPLTRHTGNFMLPAMYTALSIQNLSEYTKGTFEYEECIKKYYLDKPGEFQFTINPDEKQFVFSKNDHEIIKDELYYDAIKEQLKKYLDEELINELYQDPRKKEIIAHAFSNVELVTKQIIEKMPDVKSDSKDGISKKSRLEIYHVTYKQETLGAIANYLSSDQSETAKNILIEATNKAVNRFGEGALDYDRREWARQLLRVVTNGLVALCTLGTSIGINYVVNRKRGSLSDKCFPFFNKTKSKNKITETTETQVKNALKSMQSG